MIAASALDVLEQAAAWLADGRRVALITLVGIEGTTSRSIGTQMAVSEDGRSIGSFSGGCIEGAIVAEAQEALSARAGRVVRFGVGSPYIDVRLPCGGGIDLMFTPDPATGMINQAIATLNQRQSARMVLGDFALDLSPPMRLVVFGHGEDFTGFARLAHMWGAVVEGASPMQADVDLLRHQGIAAQHLTHVSQPPIMAGDAWSAFLFIFHDRDWEDALLPPALLQPAFFHGAVGSARTQAARQVRLAAKGLAPDVIARLHGPIGVTPATRDPASLAVSVLADVVARYGAAR